MIDAMEQHIIMKSIIINYEEVVTVCKRLVLAKA
jgi:hypothetical protein